MSLTRSHFTVTFTAALLLLGTLHASAEVRLHPTRGEGQQVLVVPTDRGVWSPVGPAGSAVLNPQGDLVADGAPAVHDGEVAFAAWNRPSTDTIRLARGGSLGWQVIADVPAAGPTSTPFIAARGDEAVVVWTSHAGEPVTRVVSTGAVGDPVLAMPGSIALEAWLSGDELLVASFEPRFGGRGDVVINVIINPIEEPELVESIGLDTDMDLMDAAEALGWWAAFTRSQPAASIWQHSAQGHDEVVLSLDRRDSLGPTGDLVLSEGRLIGVAPQDDSLVVATMPHPGLIEVERIALRAQIHRPPIDIFERQGLPAPPFPIDIPERVSVLGVLPGPIPIDILERMSVQVSPDVVPESAWLIDCEGTLGLKWRDPKRGEQLSSAWLDDVPQVPEPIDFGADAEPDCEVPGPTERLAVRGGVPLPGIPDDIPLRDGPALVLLSQPEAPGSPSAGMLSALRVEPILQDHWLATWWAGPGSLAASVVGPDGPRDALVFAAQDVFLPGLATPLAGGLPQSREPIDMFARELRDGADGSVMLAWWSAPGELSFVEVALAGPVLPVETLSHAGQAERPQSLVREAERVLRERQR